MQPGKSISKMGLSHAAAKWMFTKRIKMFECTWIIKEFKEMFAAQAI